MRCTGVLAFFVSTFAVASIAHADQGDLLVRLRGIAIVPLDSSKGIEPDLTGAKVSVGNAIVPELDFTYMATDYIGAELILGTAKHNISGAAALDGTGKLASTWLLPPTLTAQFHPFPKARVRPYVGAGLNYTIFYSEKSTATLDGALGAATKVSLANHFGYALQVGTDLGITDDLFVNVDLKYIGLSTTATLETGGTSRTVDVSLNPLVIGFGVGMVL